jgi:hypothetical protein
MGVSNGDVITLRDDLKSGKANERKARPVLIRTFRTVHSYLRVLRAVYLYRVVCNPLVHIAYQRIYTWLDFVKNVCTLPCRIHTWNTSSYTWKLSLLCHPRSYRMG